VAVESVESSEIGEVGGKKKKKKKPTVRWTGGELNPYHSGVRGIKNPRQVGFTLPGHGKYGHPTQKEALSRTGSRKFPKRIFYTLIPNLRKRNGKIKKTISQLGMNVII